MSSSLGSISVPKSILFYKISTLQRHLKPTSCCDAVLVLKIFSNATKRCPKMLCRNCGKRPWGPFGHTKLGSWSPRHLHCALTSTFWSHPDANWVTFLPSARCSAIRAKAILLVNQCTPPMRGFIVRNLSRGAEPRMRPLRSSFNSQSYRAPPRLISLHLNLTLTRFNSTRTNASKHMYSESMTLKHLTFAIGWSVKTFHLCLPIQHFKLLGRTPWASSSFIIQ